MKRFVILAVLLFCQQAQADTYIVAFSSYPNDEAQQVVRCLLPRVHQPVHCHYIAPAAATKATFANNMQWLKKNAKKTTWL